MNFHATAALAHSPFSRVFALIGHPRAVMVQAPTVIFAFSVLSLLLAVAGGLFVFFDWNAARRREYLYLYFTEEKPGYDYFAAARRRRTQYNRLLFAFGTLGLRQFLSVILAASVSQPADWDAWLTWWSDGIVTNRRRS